MSEQHYARALPRASKVRSRRPHRDVIFPDKVTDLSFAV